MISLSQIETDLTAAIKGKDQIAMDTLRGLKTRVQNEKIAKQKEPSEEDLLALIRSEVKRRKEAVASYSAGGRAELAEKEQKEAIILEKYLPPQLMEPEISSILDKLISENNFTAKDFGKAMAAAKAKVGSSAEGGLLAKFLKEKLK